MTQQDVKPWGALNWPNRISLVRLLLVGPFIILLLNQRTGETANDWGRYGALAIFMVMALSDAIDGYLARRLDAHTRLGKILDPLADKALITASVILLSLESTAIKGARLPNWVVVVAIGKDLWIVLGFVVIYFVTDRWRSHATVSGKLNTFGQVVMIGMALIAPDLNDMVPTLGTWLVRVLAYLVGGLCVATVISYTRLGLKFIARDQKPLDHNGNHSAGPDGPH